MRLANVLILAGTLAFIAANKTQMNLPSQFPSCQWMVAQNALIVCCVGCLYFRFIVVSALLFAYFYA